MKCTSKLSTNNKNNFTPPQLPSSSFRSSLPPLQNSRKGSIPIHFLLPGPQNSMRMLHPQAEQMYAVVSPSRTRGKKKREYENNEIKGDKRQCYENTAPGLSRKEEKGEYASNTLPTKIQLAGKSGYENISIPNPRMKEESNVYATPRSVQGDVHMYAVPSAKNKDNILPPNADMGEYSTIPENN